MKHITITIEARDGHALLAASKWFAGFVTSWMIGRQRAVLTRTRNAPGWLVQDSRDTGLPLNWFSLESATHDRDGLPRGWRR